MPPRPEFEAPPVVEVALGVQFEPLKALRTHHLALFWNEVRDRYPKIEERPPMEPMSESFGVSRAPGKPRLAVQIVQGPPLPRYWLVSENDGDLIQIQQDRFVVNWRGFVSDRKYPRYESVRERFEQDLDAFESYLRREGLGEVKADLCEVLYANHIPVGPDWLPEADLHKVLTVFSDQTSDGFLPPPEDVVLVARFPVEVEGEPAGRLQINAECARRASDDAPIIALNLTMRGKPQGEGRTGVLTTLDTGRDRIVRGFTSVTTALAHRAWGRCDQSTPDEG